MDLLEALSELMNFQYEIYEAPDGQYGRMTPNKTWNGMINELYENVSNTYLDTFKTFQYFIFDAESGHWFGSFRSDGGT